MRLTRLLIQSFLPQRPKQAHKGSFGRLLIIAGSDKMSGAAVLCARAALQTGAGMTCLALPKSRQCVAAAALPETLTLGLPEKEGCISLRALPVLTRYIQTFKPSLIVLGPGLAKAPFILPFLKKNKLPALLDADALNALACSKQGPALIYKRFPVICTPHPGEMARLLQKPLAAAEKIRTVYAKTLSGLTGGVSVLKGFHSVITDGKTVYINPTGGPALSKAGTGDTLTGMIAGLWAQLGTADGFNNESALKAAAAGVYLHGLCGDLAAQKLTDRCVLACDVAAQLPRAMKKVLAR